MKTFQITSKKYPFNPRVGIRNISDYSPFGVLLKERTVESANFRLGFQGQERDDEVKGEGNSVNFSFRMHDPRVGRFFAVDPLTENFAWNSPYAFCENQVTQFIEFEGLERAIQPIYGTVNGVTTIINSDQIGKPDFKSIEAPVDEYLPSGPGLLPTKKSLVPNNKPASNTPQKATPQKTESFNLDPIKTYNDNIGMLTGFTTELTTGYVATQFKSNSNLYSFQYLRNSQQTFRTTFVLGKFGSNALSLVKFTGSVSSIATPVFVGYDMYSKSHDNDPTTNVTPIDYVDFGVGTAGAGAAFYGMCGGTGPVGWGVGIVSGIYGIGRYVYETDLTPEAPMYIDSPMLAPIQNNGETNTQSVESGG